MHQGARDRHALHFTAGELLRRIEGARPQTDPLQHRTSARLGLRCGRVEQPQGERDVLQQVQMGQDVEGLKHEAVVAAPQARHRVVVQPLDRRGADPDAATVDRLQAGDAVEQRRFAYARLTDDRNALARLDAQGKPVEEGALRRPGERL